jgi:uncharacterized protein (DUF1501 family)
MSLTRRSLLKASALGACSLAAHPLLTSVTFAAVPGEERLVVIVLRGGLDGLDTLRPVGDPDFASLRPGLTQENDASDLDGFYALHEGLWPLLPLWRAGELAFAHAVSTPYRDKRSHFDGQTILEAGTGAADTAPEAAQGGWLNRMLGAFPGATSETAYAIGDGEMPLLSGAFPVRSWAPDTRLALTPQSRLLLERVYRGDPLFREAGLAAMDIADGLAGAQEPGEARGGVSAAIAAFAAERLREETRIAAFSINGWDTHRDQATALPRALGNLAQAILALRDGLGPVWGRTTLLAITEFGRTARENGSRGTDHGTGGLMLAAGGAVRGGRVLGRWPGLAEADLYERRDLMPTADLRAYAGWALRGLFGLDRALIEASIFPGLDLGADPGLIL